MNQSREINHMRDYVYPTFYLQHLQARMTSKWEMRWGDEVKYAIRYERHIPAAGAVRMVEGGKCKKE